MSNRVFVGNLSWNVTEQQLTELFSQAGTVASVFIPMDKAAGHPRGFAFVEMASDAEAQKAIEMFNGYDLGGRALACNEARPKQER
ncbi:RNA-binding protein [Patescibacteria group bacterium]|nr:MAG: RNA-binding protein [Patescibacteria group bacterium]